MTVFNIFIIVVVTFIALDQRGKLIKTRKELQQYADRMEAAELDLHAIRSVAANLLHNTGQELKKLEKPDQYFLERLADNLIEVQHIVETRGPATIGGQPYWCVEPQENSYKYSAQYPMFPD
ncbi:hypothetical protein SAMN05192562_11018 [Kosakonia arachidis]|uniref:Uncharacterized protein n=2 Tax=Kosakonia arachidis TaxID=551989 RepID=A0A1I7E511_9ENTR|nr:hypothetical protein SAMN05192562_11018 [Kosakonia arachidis]